MFKLSSSLSLTAILILGISCVLCGRKDNSGPNNISSSIVSLLNQSLNQSSPLKDDDFINLIKEPEDFWYTLENACDDKLKWNVGDVVEMAVVNGLLLNERTEDIIAYYYLLPKEKKLAKQKAIRALIYVFAQKANWKCQTYSNNLFISSNGIDRSTFNDIWSNTNHISGREVAIRENNMALNCKGTNLKKPLTFENVIVGGISSFVSDSNSNFGGMSIIFDLIGMLTCGRHMIPAALSPSTSPFSKLWQKPTAPYSFEKAFELANRHGNVMGVTELCYSRLAADDKKFLATFGKAERTKNIVFLELEFCNCQETYDSLIALILNANPQKVILTIEPGMTGRWNDVFAALGDAKILELKLNGRICDIEQDNLDQLAKLSVKSLVLEDITVPDKGNTCNMGLLKMKKIRDFLASMSGPAENLLCKESADGCTSGNRLAGNDQRMLGNELNAKDLVALSHGAMESLRIEEQEFSLDVADTIKELPIKTLIVKFNMRCLYKDDSCEQENRFMLDKREQFFNTVLKSSSIKNLVFMADDNPTRMHQHHNRIFCNCKFANPMKIVFVNQRGDSFSIN